MTNYFDPDSLEPGVVCYWTLTMKETIAELVLIHLST